MRTIGRMLGWLGRRGALFVLLVAALLAWQAREQVGGFLNAAQGAAQAHLTTAETLEDTASEIESERISLQERLTQAAAEARRASLGEIERSLREARSERDRLEQAKRPGWQQAASLARFDKDAVVADRKLELEIEVLDRKIAGLETMLAAGSRTAAARDRAEIAVRNCTQARSRLGDFEERFVLWRELREAVNQEGTRLSEKVRQDCAAAQRAMQDLRAARNAGGAPAWSVALTDRTADLLGRAEEEKRAAEATLGSRFDRLWEEWQVEQVLWAAAGFLLLIILTPYAIRLLFYFVLAPLAARRGAICLRVPGGADFSPVAGGASGTSIAIRLRPGEELLVRQGYLQSSSLEGAKATRWLLDARHPLSSLVTGLWFLTRVRGEGQVTTISAVRDPFVEVAVLELPEAGSCVVQPRALAAVATPVGQPLRVTSHWRLLSLHAWLTLQLRYLVFHGPARLVLKGGRGIRIERAEHGRIFGQDQLIGFSADLAYSVRRTETFWPYFLGREPLLKDMVQAGTGVLIVEETPLAGRGAGRVRSGLEGAFDAALKAVGL